MIESGYSGSVYPINPNAEEILGLRCYPSVLDVPGEVDLAVISIPSAYVMQVAEECGRKGVKALVVISAGFKETGHEGAMLERQLIELAEKYGMRIQGPNCLGLINTSSSLNLSFATAMPKTGRIGFISQSGALGTAVLDWVLKEDIGFHSFISLGNKADLDEVDFIEAMGEDEDIGVILLYIESIEHLRQLFEVKPKVAVCDLHPGYLSTQYTKSLTDVRLIQVQHHWAHVASVLAENNVNGPVIGLVCDGTGYGTDEAIWAESFSSPTMKGSSGSPIWRMCHCLEAIPQFAILIVQRWRIYGLLA